MADDSPTHIHKTTRQMTSRMLLEMREVGAAPIGRKYEGIDKWEWSIPDFRAIVVVDTSHMSKTTQQQARKGQWSAFFNLYTEEVIRACATVKRAEDTAEVGEDESYIPWLDEETIQAYLGLPLHNIYSIAVLNGDRKLVGGLFGMVLERNVTVESMFFYDSGASKFAMVALDAACETQHAAYIDMQDYYSHLGSLGATSITTPTFLATLKDTAPLQTPFVFPEVIGYDEVLAWYNRRPKESST